MRALFVPFAPSLAHVTRCLAVAEAWRERGHTAVFALGLERSELVRNAGFEIRPVPEVAGTEFRTRGFRWLTREYFVQNLRAEQAILAEVKPDIVVYDFRFTTTTAARLADLPSAGIVHGNALRLALEPRDTARLLIGDPGDTEGLSALRLRVMRRIFPIIFQIVMRTLARRFAPVLKASSLPPVHSLFEFLLGDEILVADIPGMLPAILPRNAHIVGPLMWSGWEMPAPWLGELDSRPLVYVTMGSTVEASSTLVRIIEAFRDAPYHVVVTIGHLSLPADCHLPPHIRVCPSLPGTTVARRSRLVVHHGGHETLMQALAAGVPSLMLPLNPDQILVAQQAQSLGLGHSFWHAGDVPMRPRPCTPAEIRRAADDLISDRVCLQNCRAVQQLIAASSGGLAAVDILGFIVHKNRDQVASGRVRPRSKQDADPV
jgi:UDP-N-acetylglucosamine--N-acetylmuramyl-(pentapeptide) pyrophosphoryl-undecaprenol N-acetylglucosamine transferase